MQERPPYEVEDIEEIFRSPEIRVRRFTLAPGNSIPWHRHPTTRDDYYVLAGRLEIALREPDERVSLAVGDTFRIEAGRPHTNASAHGCVFLLTQGLGAVTFEPLRD